MKSDINISDPNKILNALKREERKNKGGKLYIFLGMCPGVGKTYAMLEYAHSALEKGEDVVIGVAETHGRQETSNLLEGLPVLPLIKIEYKGKVFSELDSLAVLKRKPKIVIIDELAHTNIPGLNHEKRWQDVEEILSNNIDVYTTINIQHIESLKEDIELITGVTIHETVPDSIFERAYQMELIDIPPAQLLQRLKDGKVYLGGENITLAQSNFFKTDKLTALRELALRFAGDVVGSELDTIKFGHGAQSGKGSVLIILQPTADTKKVIRAARKFAFAAGNDIFALVLENTPNLDSAEKQLLLDNIELAQNLNAEIINIAQSDLISAVKQTIKRNGITHIILPKSQTGFLKDLFMGGSLATRLINETEVDIHIIRNTNFLNSDNGFSLKDYIYLESDFNKYLNVIISVLFVTLLNIIIFRFAGYQSAGFIYLLLVLTTGTLSTFGPIMLCAFMSMFAWDFFFIPPVFTAHISKPEDVAMCFVFLITALVTGFRTNKMLRAQKLLELREERANMLLAIAQAINSPLNRQDTFKEISKQLKRIFNGDFMFTFKDINGSFETYNSHNWGYLWTNSDKEFSVALWSMENNKMAGWGTETLSLAEALYIPLAMPKGFIGFLSYLPQQHSAPLSFDDLALLKAAANQTAVFLGQELLKERTQRVKQLEESQKIYQVVLNSISHELKTPLTVINGAVDVIVGSKGKNIAPLEDLKEASLRLNREINNILDMSRLSSDMSFKREWNDLKDILNSCLDKLKNYTAQHKIDIVLPSDLPFIRVNFALFESLFTNLLLNAVKYSPAGSVIKIKAYSKDNNIFIEVEDSGAGVEASEIASIFDKFYRGKNSTSYPGIGIGLSIAKSVVQLHGGIISACNVKPCGFKVITQIPLEEQPKI